jgi:hypothetical protein
MIHKTSHRAAHQPVTRHTSKFDIGVCYFVFLIARDIDTLATNSAVATRFVTVPQLPTVLAKRTVL